MTTEQQTRWTVSGAVSRRVRDFGKATAKARSWQCPWPIAAWVGLRYALTGDSGRFRSHAGWRVSRISRE